ncbi:MAG: hypothetical protein WBD22_13250 [Pyrinomonadaceae bacterium]
MLLKSEVLERIVAGEVSIIFRRWKRPSVKAGGTQMTKKGVLAIDSIETVTKAEITADDAARAGFLSRDELLGAIYDGEGEIYRIKVQYSGEDPRIALRENANLTGEELGSVLADLSKMDRSSIRGPWTRQYLEMIHDEPNTHAVILAKSVGLEKRTFKPMVRKLKALGLTESLRPGYRLSARGEKVLQELRKR